MSKDAPLTPRAKVLRLGAIAAGLGFAAFALAFTAGWLPSRALSPSVIVNTQESGGIHAGFRRAHAKGLCVAGTFTSNGGLAGLSSAGVFGVGSVPVIGRLSTAGANPTAPDASSPVRSLALQFALPGGQQWRTAMNTPPVLPVGTPEKFHRQLQALAPDPATGKPDPARIAAFFAAHPESAEFRAWQAGNKPSSSFATTRYHSINAFVLVAPDGQRQAVRWAMVPDAMPEPLGAGPHEPDSLQREFAARVGSAPVRWAMEFTLAGPGDATADATRAWPESRQRIVAGVLEITEASEQETSACNGINFDPLVLPRGIEASDDPILAARSAAYAESLRRRAREHRQEAAP
ncbi:MAG: catalase family peroxidase [Arenimonas sp.]|uniref:catalase family peroxidase n=1 Tax=Arenimonas sp. TaxID=1872635 RepID=UPI0025C3DC3E|nr:catalase family peroxidase [Arenimonas sp.]MBW8369094.1 catalase family peroxidase [Arenimonas sp.]